MVRMFPKYNDINDWKILEVRTIHAYNEAETAIEVLKVYIGEVDKYEVTLGWNYKAETFSIIRWISRQEYERLKEGAGTIIW